MDVTEAASSCGFKIQTAVTAGVWAALAPTEAEAKRHVTREFKRFLLLAKVYAAICDAEAGTDRVFFDFRGIKMRALVGPGDNGEPVLTIMLEGED